MDADVSMSDAPSSEYFVPDMDVDGQVPPPGPPPGPAGPAGPPFFMLSSNLLHSNQAYRLLRARRQIHSQLQPHQ